MLHRERERESGTESVITFSYLKDGQQGHRSYQTGQRQGKKDKRGNAAGLLPFPSWETEKCTTTLVIHKYSHNQMFQPYQWIN